jgi:leader peptidase (prepilin peptidase)/N-methyltransferase
MLLVVAPFIGSFLGVLAMRLADGRRVLWGRSACDACGHKLGVRDLVPIFSWAASRGRCRYCGARISWFYPAVELAALVIVGWAATETSASVLVASCVLGWTLLALALADWRSFVLPNALTLFLLLSGLACAYLFDGDHLIDHLIGALGGFLAFAAVALAYRVLRHREGLGWGDAKFMAGAGAWLAWQSLPTVVLFAVAFGFLFVLARTAAGRSVGPADRIPFGTFLAGATWLVWLYGPLVPS